MYCMYNKHDCVFFKVKEKYVKITTKYDTTRKICVLWQDTKTIVYSKYTAKLGVHALTIILLIIVSPSKFRAAKRTNKLTHFFLTPAAFTSCNRATNRIFSSPLPATALASESGIGLSFYNTFVAGARTPKPFIRRGLNEHRVSCFCFVFNFVLWINAHQIIHVSCYVTDAQPVTLPELQRASKARNNGRGSSRGSSRGRKQKRQQTERARGIAHLC